MKLEKKTLIYNLYTNDKGTEQIREIKGISIMNRKKNKERKWGPWIPCDAALAKVIMGIWDTKDC